MITAAQPPEIEEAVTEWSRLAGAALAEAGQDAGFRNRWRALAGLGALRDVAVADKDGTGTPGPVTRAVAMVEGIGLAGAEAGLCYAVASQRFGIQFPLLGRLGETGQRIVPDIESGRVLLCHALTEEGGGSDPLSMETCAEPLPDGGFVLNGRKSFVTAAPVADVALVFARTAADLGPFSLTPFLVDLHAPGVERSTPFPKTALVDVPMGSIDFDGVRLPADAVVGEEGSGLALLTVTTTWERGLLLSYALGPMRRVLRRTLDWAGTRRHFGRRMGASHLVASRVSGMALAFHRTRELVYRIAARLDAGERPRQLASEAALTKISASEDYQEFSRHAAALGGVRSFIEDSGLTEDVLTPVAAATYAGPNDLLRISVARELGLPVEN